MTNEAAEQFEMPKAKKQDWQYLFWPGLFGFVVGLILGLVLGSHSEEKPISQVCQAICKQVKSFNETTGECECWDGKE